MSILWKDVPGYEGAYQVSDEGRARSLSRILPDGRRWPGKVLRSAPRAGGAIFVDFGSWNGENAKRIGMSRVVLSAFIGPQPKGMEAIHIDGRVTNNRPENLKWGTRSAQVSGRLNYGRDGRGEKNGRAKLSDKEVFAIRCGRANGAKIKCLAAEFGVSVEYISGIVNNRFRAIEEVK